MSRRILTSLVNLFLFIFSAFISIGICVGGVSAYDSLNSEGMFSRWKSLSSPPDKIEKILSADYSTIWIETKNGSVYYLDVLCWLQVRECQENVWVKADIMTETLPIEADGEFGYYLARQGDCVFHDDFELKYFQEPQGQIAECLKTLTLYPEVFVVTYYARSGNNTIQYWHLYSSSNNYLQQIIGSVLAGLILTMGVFNFLKSKLNLQNIFRN